MKYIYETDLNKFEACKTVYRYLRNIHYALNSNLNDVMIRSERNMQSSVTIDIFAV